MSNKLADSFIGIYSISKTLRFELKPMGRTLEHIQASGMLDTDLQRSEDYKAVKKIIDRYHKILIDEALRETELSGLEDYYSLYCNSNKDDKDVTLFDKIQKDLRKQIVTSLSKHHNYGKLFKKELIEEVLLDYAQDDNELALIKSFKGFTTYFQGFNQNRQNMYSSENKSTAIAYRLIHQNLPKYIDNIKVYSKIVEMGDVLDISLLQKNIRVFLGDHSVEEFFELSGYNYVLTQKGIDTYNTIIGGYTKDNGEKVKGINEYVNIYNQQHKGQSKLPKLKPLFKQILSDRESASFLTEQFTSDSEVIDAVAVFMDGMEQDILYNHENIAPDKLLSQMCEYDLEHIYIKNDLSVTAISQELFGDWSVIKDIISDEYDKKELLRNNNVKINDETYLNKKRARLKKENLSIAELDKMLNRYGHDEQVEEYFSRKITEVVNDIIRTSEKCRILFEHEYNGNLKKDEGSIELLKAYLDSMKDLQALLKIFMLADDVSDGDSAFYAEVNRIWDALIPLNTLYNKVRNYVTQKPYSTEKYKLNFDKATLMNGWDKSKERDCLGVIFEKDGLYYLGIISTKNTSILKTMPAPVTESRYRKMNYKYVTDPSRMLPKVYLSKKGKAVYKPSEKLVKNYELGTHKKGDSFSKEDCHALIDYFKQSISMNDDWKIFGFKFSDTKTYDDISVFYHEVKQQGYSITFEDVDTSFIDELVEKGQLYLFQIYNKDFSPNSSGTPNLHTLYWRALFSEENQKDIVYKLNGNAEVFYRKRSIEDKDIIRHKAKEKIANKNAGEGEKKYSIFEYDLIKDRRFTVDKFQFHVPIEMNYCKQSSNNMNTEVNRLLKNTDVSEINVIGIDRGERNLLYAVVVGHDGRIIDQVQLNKIKSCNKEGISHTKDYQELLDKKEKEREAARENWKTIGNIKELKEGYLSQAIHVIVELMIEHNAVVVMEDLNFGFKRGRQKVEKQVYQKFEKMLIDKLNYYVDKKKDFDENGGLYHAYQLTNQFVSFDRLGKQSGLLYYIPAWLTSKIDPTTGFANLFYIKYKSVEDTRAFINKFEDIRYNIDDGYFEFEFDYSKFDARTGESRTKWTVCSYGRRIERYRNNVGKTDYRDIKNITDEWVKLFDDYGIEYSKSGLKEKMTQVDNTDYYKRFIRLFSLMLQMRNSRSDTGEDYLISPVKNNSGLFFESGTKEYLPKDADANGAYHIARKGWWVIEQLKQMDDNELGKIPIIKNGEWLKYVQDNPLTE